MYRIKKIIWSVFLIFIAPGLFAGCDRGGIVPEAGTGPEAPPTSFPQFFLEKGSDADSSYISLRGVRKTDDILEVQATSWGVVETGLVLIRMNAPKSATFLFIGRCGTVPTRTWEKVMLSCELVPADQDSLWQISFVAHGDTLSVVKTTAFRYPSVVQGDGTIP